MPDDVYYATLKAALDAVVGADPHRSEAAIKVVTGFTIRDAVEIPGGKTITLKSESDEEKTIVVKTITGDITVENGGTLKLESVDGAGALNVDGIITVEGGAVLELAGAVSVNEVVSGNRPVTVSGELSPSGGVTNVTTGKSGCAVVVAGNDYILTKEDCGKFIVNGGQFAVKLAGNEGILARAVAGRQVNGTERYYPSIQAAVDASPGSPDTITVLRDHDITGEVSVTGNRNVRLVPVYPAPAPDGKITLTRASVFTTGSLFTVASGASLMLECNGDSIVIDGNEPPRRRAAGYRVSVALFTRFVPIGNL